MMKPYLKLFLLTFSLMIFSCSSEDDSGNGGGTDGGNLSAQAVYRVTITGQFTAQSHPTDFPAGAGFDKMFFLAHSSSSTLFRTGSAGSDGLKLYAKDGDVSVLNTEHTTSEDGVSPTIIKIGDAISGTGTDVFDITITPSTTLFSFVSKISPSPDWFVGVDSFDLVNPDNTLVEEVTFQLFPYDAGADGGTTYESPDSDEAGPVTLMNSPPLAAGNGIVNSLGTVTFQRIDQSQ